MGERISILALLWPLFLDRERRLIPRTKISGKAFAAPPRRLRVKRAASSIAQIETNWRGSNFGVLMNKRTFLKLCSAAIASGMVSPYLSAGDEELHNWSGNIIYGTEKLFAAKTVEQVQDFVRTNERLKVLGTRHCFNTIADSRFQFLSLRDMNRVISIDEIARTATVEGGISYGQLGPFLDGKGWALHNLASLPHISVAGAITTATHGSGEKNGNLATAVSGLEIVTAAGDCLRLSCGTDAEFFRGAVVGLGALGVITKVTLDIQPTYQMQQYVYENVPMSALKDHFDEIEGCAYSVSLFTDWQNHKINEVWLKIRMDQGKPFEAPVEFFGGTRATRNLHPIKELSAESCTEQMGVPGPWYDRLPHFRMGFTPSAGKELQTEYFVPRHNAVDAIFAVDRLSDQLKPYLLITEIRTIAADDLWMSTCYRRPSVTIHFTWKPDWLHVKSLLPIIERQLAPFSPRPHWAKLFTIPPAQLESQYVKLSDFVSLARSYDPKGKFMNDFLDANIFGHKV